MPEEKDTTAVAEPSETSESATEASSVDNFNMNILRLELDQFEGPFEVLLYLIKEQEIDIFDIPILQVTEQYLQFLELLRTEHLDAAGGFLGLAATLIQIKSRMILPVEMDQDDDDDEIEEEDPRLELVEKLLEYRKFRDLARRLGERESHRSDLFGRRVKPVYEPGDDDDEELLEVSLYDLTKSVRSMVRFLMGELSHNIKLESASVDEKISLIEEILETRESMTWTELCRMSANRIELVCSLLAILELCRMQRIRARQHGPFGEIRLFTKVQQDANPPEGNDGADLALA